MSFSGVIRHQCNNFDNYYKKDWKFRHRVQIYNILELGLWAKYTLSEYLIYM